MCPLQISFYNAFNIAESSSPIHSAVPNAFICRRLRRLKLSISALCSPLWPALLKNAFCCCRAPLRRIAPGQFYSTVFPGLQLLPPLGDHLPAHSPTLFPALLLLCFPRSILHHQTRCCSETDMRIASGVFWCCWTSDAGIF